MTLDSLIYILRSKKFSGALLFPEGKIFFAEGSIKLASYCSESGEAVLDVLPSLPLPSGTEVVELSKEQVELWLKWQAWLHDEREIYVSPLPEINRKSLKRYLEESGLAYLLVQNSTKGG